MTENEMAFLLGIVVEPVKNRVPCDARIRSEIHNLKETFKVLTPQKASIGTINPDIWAELVPWHSLN